MQRNFKLLDCKNEINYKNSQRGKKFFFKNNAKKTGNEKEKSIYSL